MHGPYRASGADWAQTSRSPLANESYGRGFAKWAPGGRHSEIGQTDFTLNVITREQLMFLPGSGDCGREVGFSSLCPVGA